MKLLHHVGEDRIQYHEPFLAFATSDLQTSSASSCLISIPVPNNPSKFAIKLQPELRCDGEAVSCSLRDVPERVKRNWSVSKCVMQISRRMAGKIDLGMDTQFADNRDGILL